ncbi:MAG: hypothetical protein H0U57_01420 [Tatlockia sp.]|nr:hypothetical protein [Tatlockia sp.]
MLLSNKYQKTSHELNCIVQKVVRCKSGGAVFYTGKKVNITEPAANCFPNSLIKSFIGLTCAYKYKTGISCHLIDDIDWSNTTD